SGRRKPSSMAKWTWCTRYSTTGAARVWNWKCWTWRRLRQGGHWRAGRERNCVDRRRRAGLEGGRELLLADERSNRGARAFARRGAVGTGDSGTPWSSECRAIGSRCAGQPGTRKRRTEQQRDVRVGSEDG